MLQLMAMTQLLTFKMMSSLLRSQYALTLQLPVSHVRALPMFRLCGDNVDKVVKQRYMRPDSVHYFHSYSVRDRIDFTCLSVLVPRPIASTLQQHALNLLPSPSDNHALRENCRLSSVGHPPNPVQHAHFNL